MRRPSDRTAVAITVSLLAAACTRGSTRDPGPRPGAEHQAIVRVRSEAVLAKHHELAEPSRYVFSTPLPGRVAAWHWEPQDEGTPHQLAWRDGWLVEFVVTPRYAGYPPQPDSRRMAFFADGALRGLFAEGARSAPLELDAWDALWIDQGWRPGAPPGAAPR